MMAVHPTPADHPTSTHPHEEEKAQAYNECPKRHAYNEVLKMNMFYYRFV